MKLAVVSRFVLVAVSALGVFGCAEERAPINRVQANALDKTFFVGDRFDDADDPEFYYRATIVDVDHGATQTGLFTAGYGQAMVRVHWEIAEDLLLARLSYDRIDNTTGEIDPGSAGQVAAAFPIESHFDIRRSYNPTTGEELNVVEENTTDRPWYERDYIRVDWSQNLITSAYELDTLSGTSIFSDPPLTYEPTSHFVGEPSSPDAPVFDTETGYFDVTNKVYVRPEIVSTPFGVFPACFFSPDIFHGSAPEGNCNPVELKLRMAFRRVEDSDYEPISWDGTRMNMFGMFVWGSRYGYDPKYGVVDEQWRRFPARYNIWAESHARDESGELVPCYTEETTPAGADPKRDIEPRDGTDDECANVGDGSRCDPYTHACTIPYRQRGTRTIPIYYGPGSDPTLFDVASSVSNEWDGALRHVVQTARYTECLRVLDRGGPGSAPPDAQVLRDQIASCRESYPPDLETAMNEVPPVLVFCHNPVAEGDAPECGAEGTEVRVGDLRYHMANIISDPQIRSPWGIVADAIDPLTGEVISASFNMWNARTELFAQKTVDRMRWYLGELSNDEVAAGTSAVGTLAAAGRTPLPASNPPILSKNEVEARTAALDRTFEGERTARPLVNERELVRWAANLTAERFGDQLLGKGNASLLERFERAKTSGAELGIMTQPYYEMSGVSSSLPLNQTSIDLVSPLRGSSTLFRTQLDREREIARGHNGQCMLEAPDPASTGRLARILAEKFPLPENPSQADVIARDEKWFQFIKRHVTRGVFAHEMGHSMGLRHVFTSSADALNYKPQYWQLRTRDGAETDTCASATDDGHSCVGPRWLDPMTEEEDHGMLHRWSHTSVMEYPGELTQEMLGISAYDRAALRFGYADVTEVWDEDNVACPFNGTRRACTRGGQILEARLDSFGGVIGPSWGITTDQPIHYSALQNEFGLVRNCRPAELSPPPGYDEGRDGMYIPEFDSEIVNGTVCDTPPVDYVAYTELEFDAPTASEQNVFSGDVRKFDALGRVRKPYLFASDEWADLGNVAVLRSDNGADPYETIHFLTSEYEEMHLFDNHRRERVNFAVRPAVDRFVSRYHDKLMSFGKGLALLHEIYAGAGITDEYQPGRPFQANALATAMIFDHFARVLTRPSSGTHVQVADASGENLLRSIEQLTELRERAPVILPEGPFSAGGDRAFGARPLHNKLDDREGYYATDYPLWIGSYYEKSIAAAMLTDSFDNFVPDDRETFFDGRYRNVGFASMFPDGVRRLFGAAISEDRALLGWRAAGAQASQTSIVPFKDSNGVLTEPMGQRAWWALDPRVCWPRAGRVGCFDVAGEGYDGEQAPEASVAIDPEVGFDIQKFVIFWALMYLPENQKLDWVDMMRIWLVGGDADPTFPVTERRAFRDPLSGQLYVAHSYGTEVIDGKDVERGIAARAIDWMNLLMREAYVVESEDADTGEVTVARHPDDENCPAQVTSCTGQPVEQNAEFVARVKGYKSVLDYLHSTTKALGLADPEQRGVY
jgi:hypothetical protein